ncbi:MAG TPA: acylphosphatase [Gemmatimonadaceae bacterium]|nr:acylphosphatase [Gemmatimonadaceae bacterium]
MTRRRVVVRGRVQGVGFRWFVREHARSLSLAGWVRNRVDGMVELEVAGPDEKVAELLSYVGEGPDGAVVAAVEDVPVANPAPELPDPFTIER